MSDAIPAMHKDFPRWHAEVAVGTDVEHKTARWIAVHALAEDADRPMVEALVRLAFDTTRQPPAGPYLEIIHQAFRDADDTFDPKKAQRELQVFAGACLSLLFERSDKIGAAAALSVATAAFVGARSPRLPLDLVGQAEDALLRTADGNRKRPSLAICAESPDLDVDGILNNPRNDWGWVQQALRSTVNGLRAALQELAARQASANRNVDRFIQVQDEELQMLWWLIGRHSFDLDRAFDAIASEAQPLLFAKELSDITTSLPGPRSIIALLARAGLEARNKVTVATAINAMDASWLPEVIYESPSPVTAPLHLAIARQSEAGGGTTWVPNWSAVVGVDGKRQISSVMLAVQFYRERLLFILG